MSGDSASPVSAGVPQSVAASDAAALAPDSALATADLADLRAQWAATPDLRTQDVLTAKINELGRYAAGGDARPAWWRPQAPDGAAVARLAQPHDPLADAMAEAAAPATPEQHQRALVEAKARGLAPELASDGVATLADLGLPDGAARAILGRAADLYAGATDLPVLSNESAAPLLDATARAFGGADKLAAINSRVRAYLESKGALADLDARGITRTAFALDVATLQTLHNEAVRAGF